MPLSQLGVSAGTIYSSQFGTPSMQIKLLISGCTSLLGGHSIEKIFNETRNAHKRNQKYMKASARKMFVAG